MNMRLNWPIEEGHYITQAAAEKLKGQWVTVLAFGRSVLGQIEEAYAADSGRSLYLEVKVDQGAEGA